MNDDDTGTDIEFTPPLTDAEKELSAMSRELAHARSVLAYIGGGNEDQSTELLCQLALGTKTRLLKTIQELREKRIGT